jgi:hypothetical protein
VDAAIRPAMALLEGVAGVRFLLFLFFAPIVAVAVVGGLTAGNPVAVGFAIGFMAPLCLGLALIVKPQPPRKADPAKIARLEVELQTGPAWEEFKRQQAHRERVAKMAAGPREGTTAW